MLNERVKFRLLHMDCCGHLLCWINPRLPNYCPECGKSVYPNVKGWATLTDENALLRFTDTRDAR